MAKKSAALHISILLIVLSFIIFSVASGQSNLSKILKDKTGSNSGLKASVSYSPVVPVTGVPIRFICRTNNTPESWLWEFGDGEISYEPSTAHIYENAGVYNVKLTVTLNGTTASATKKVRVYAARVESTQTKSQELVAAFEFSPATPEAGTNVQFTDQSTGGPTSWRWDFGDGSQSSAQNPQHQYSNPGTYNVMLTISNGSATKSVTRTLTVIAALTPGFSYSPVNPESGESIQFQDTSSGNPSSWNWNFGDGTTSNLKNPTHIYNNSGSFTVTLQVSNGYYTKSISKSVTVLAPITVDFSYSPANPVAGQDVQFVNGSTGSITGYSWNFGDGSTSTLKDPTHKFNSAGSYTVTLTATGPRGSKSTSKTITVNQSLSPSFTFSPASPYAGQSVQFTDTSTGSPTSWQWNFGDGSNSTAKNPTHTYSTAGTYTVTLTVSNGSETKTTSKSITVKPVVQADFTYSPTNPPVGTTIQFTDKSSGNITSWSWQFGDGTTSTQRNPSKAYSASGSYNVKLTVSDGTSSNSMTQTVTVVASLVADFSFSPSAPAVGQEVQFLDNSQGSPTSWSWDFGDGSAKSTVKNPTHTYSQAGTFSVKLTISNATASSTQTKSLTVSSSSKRIITAASCALADVQAAIAQANPGDTVIVPNGQAVWSQKLVIRKGIILKAASKGGVTIKSNYASSRDYLIVYSPDNPAYDEPFRISGFLFNLDGNSGGISIENSTLYPLRKIRIDNNQFTNPNWYFLRINGTVYGVCDNNIVTTDTVANACYGLNAQTWNNLIFDFGTADNFYFEDNLFYLKDTFTGSGAAGRYAIRYNKFYNMSGGTISPFIDMHGNMGTGGNHSGMGIEVYENEFYLNGYGCRIVDQRGGKGLIYNNRIITTPSVWANFNVREEYYDYLNPPAKSPINGQPQHVSDTYSWGNTKNGVQIVNDHDDNLKVTQTLNYEGEGVVPSLDIHFWRSVSPFNGTSGVGVGTISQRPASCSKEGVAWWATDENRLYRWRNGKWELYYVPYTYPHPLRTILGD